MLGTLLAEAADLTLLRAGRQTSVAVAVALHDHVRLQPSRLRFVSVSTIPRCCAAPKEVCLASWSPATQPTPDPSPGTSHVMASAASATCLSRKASRHCGVCSPSEFTSIQLRLLSAATDSCCWALTDTRPRPGGSQGKEVDSEQRSPACPMWVGVRGGGVPSRSSGQSAHDAPIGRYDRVRSSPAHPGRRDLRLRPAQVQRPITAHAPPPLIQGEDHPTKHVSHAPVIRAAADRGLT